LNKELLQKAANLLVPAGIFLRDSRIFTHKDFHVGHGPNDLQVQYKGANSGKFQLLLEDESAKSGLVKFYFKAGIRLVDGSLEENDDGFVKVEIEAMFSAEYQLEDTQKFEKESMEEFLKYNVKHHVWPYWREYVQSNCARMGLPVVPVPHQFYGPPNQTRPDEKKGNKKKP